MGGPRIYAHGWTLLPVMAPVEAARFALANGFDGFELHCNPLDFWPGAVDGSTLAELAALGRDGLGYALYGGDAVNPATGLPELLRLNDETLRRLLDVATAVGAQVLCLHPGLAVELDHLQRKGVPFETARFDRANLEAEGRRRSVAAYRRWSEWAGAAGVRLAIENEVHTRFTVAPTAATLAAMVDAIASPDVKVNFDTGHAHIGGGLTEEFQALKRHVAHVHMNDNRTTRVSEHLPLGEGAVDFPAIAADLGRMEVALALEIYAPERALAATLASRDYVLRLLGRA